MNRGADMIFARLLNHDDQLSRAILMNTGGVVAHAEAVMQGGSVVGAFAEGGVQERPLDYDGGKFKLEILLALPADDGMTASFEHFMRSPEVMGEKYDFPGLANFLHLGVDLHAKHHVFCSALIHDALRWCRFFDRPMPIPGHYVTPIILHQELLARPDVRVVTRSDPAFLSHVSKGDGAKDV